MMLFLRMIDLTKHFIVKQKSILKNQKLLLQDVTLRAWVLKYSLIGKDNLIGYKHFPEYFFNFVRFYVIIHQEIDLKRSSTYRCPFY